AIDQRKLSRDEDEVPGSDKRLVMTDGYRGLRQNQAHLSQARFYFHTRYSSIKVSRSGCDSFTSVIPGGDAPVDGNDLSGDPLAILTGEIDNGLRDIRTLADAAQRMQAAQLLDLLWAHELVEQRGSHHRRRNAVHPDVVFGQLNRQVLRQRVNGPFGGGRTRTRCGGDGVDRPHRADVDD